MKLVLLSLVSLVFILKVIIKILDYKNRNASIPENVKDVYNQDEYLNWRNYKMDNLKLSTFQLVISFLVIMVLLIFNIHFLLFDFISKYSDSLIIKFLFILLILDLIELFFDSFFEYYQTFTIEEKYSFNKTTPKLFIKDKVIKFIAMLIVETGLIYALYSVYTSFTNVYLFLVISLAIVFSIILIIPLLFPLVSKLFNKMTPLEDGPLKTEIINYTNKVNFPIQNVFVVDASKRSTKANAYFMGYGKKRRIVLFDTLINQLSTEEIVAVLAHEVGHAKGKHIFKQIPLSLFGSLLVLGGIFLLVSNSSVSVAFGFPNSNFLFSALLFFELFPLINIFSGLISNSFSRRYEYQADYYAATTYSKEEIISALKMIAKNNLSNLSPHPLLVLIYASHPPLSKRIEAVNNINEI